MKLKRIISLFSLLAALWLVVAPVVSADDLPPFLTLNDDGTINFDASGLTPGDPINFPPPEGYGLEFGIPGTDVTACMGCMTFNTYTDSSGQTVVVPTAYTAIVMAVTGQNPFSSEPSFSLYNGVLGVAAYAGLLENIGIDPSDVTDMSNWQLDPLFWLQLNAALNDPNSPLFQDAFFWASGLFVFDCDPVSGCVVADQPPVPPDPYELICQAQGNCLPKGECPSREWVIQQRDPVYSSRKLAPDFPVVVGQDPDQRGVDVQAAVTVFPVLVTYTYEHREPGERVCHWFATGGQGGCGGGYDRLDSPTGDWYDDGYWGVENTEKKECRRHTDSYVDRIGPLTISAALSDESAAWITGPLASKYPGAHVYQASWPLMPGRPISLGGFNASHTSLSASYLGLPMKDPGDYTLEIAGRTFGTPWTKPLDLGHTEEGAFKVDAMFVALTR